jgi:poly-beta-1,6-N-acetyl-D-glucosamine synthase
MRLAQGSDTDGDAAALGYVTYTKTPPVAGPLPPRTAPPRPAAPRAAPPRPAAPVAGRAPREPSVHSQMRGLEALARLGTTIRFRRPRRIVDPAKVYVLIPAHNESGTITPTLESLRKQTLPPRQVIVVCDNCTDATEHKAARAGARTFRTYRNTGKKAGALNQALSRLLPTLNDDDLVLVMDADSQLNEGWLEEAELMLRFHRRVGAVCGVFVGEPGHGLAVDLQRNEYVRYARTVYRRRQAPVLSGTGTLFRASALAEVASERGRLLPGVQGEYYNSQSITEDNEITLALKTLGHRCLPGPGCVTVTEVMPTFRDLYRQRMRWQQGALSDLRRYGFTRVTFMYWARQAALYAGFCAALFCWAVMGWSMAVHPGINVGWTIGIMGISFLERLWTVRKAGLKGMVLSALMLPEFGYDVFRMVVFFRSLSAELRQRQVAWNHLQR